MDILDKFDMILDGDNPLKNMKWFVDQGIANRLMDKKTQVEVIWKSGANQVKVQFRDAKTSEYIGHSMVPTKGMKSKEFLKHVDSDMKNIWSSKKKGMNEDVYDAEAIVGNKKITKPMSAKSDDDAKKQFENFLKMQMKRGHIAKGEIKNIKVKKA